MSAFLAGSPVVAKVAAKPVAKRNVTVRAAAPSDGVTRRAAVAGVLALFVAQPASAETKRVRAKDAVEAYSPYAGSMTKSAGSGFGKYKAPRAFLKDEQAEILKAYGLERLPGQ